MIDPHAFQPDNDGGCAVCPLPRANARHVRPASRQRKARGMATQRIAAERLRPLFPYATARGAGEQGADLLHTPGWAFEVKATSRDPLLPALRQAAANAAGGELPVVLWRPNGLGPERVGEWVAAMTFDTLARIIGEATP